MDYPRKRFRCLVNKRVVVLILVVVAVQAACAIGYQARGSLSDVAGELRGKGYPGNVLFSGYAEKRRLFPNIEIWPIFRGDRSILTIGHECSLKRVAASLATRME